MKNSAKTAAATIGVTALIAGTALSTGAQGGAATTAPQALDAGERATLVYVRQEEKLARDVYRALSRRYDDPVFSRIAVSEQRHMDAIGRLLARYRIDDPVAGMPEGRYADPSLTRAYSILTTRGATSLTSALGVGERIERDDITDLGKRIAQADNTDIDTVLSHLREGSRHHLRAFTLQLRA